jgi:two-component system chemotaxis response regulator CheY
VAASGAIDTAPAQEVRKVNDRTVAWSPAKIPATSALSIILVEPSRSQALIIRNYLHDLGFHDILIAPSGQKALELASQKPPRVVISTMHLEDMTGMRLAQAMRAREPLSSIGFVLITSSTDGQEANLLSRVENCVRLPKPFGRDELGKALAAASAGSVPGPTPATPDALGHLKVLVVDDSAAARSHVRSVLASLGLRRFTEATDGLEARARLETESFDLVITDYHMPRCNGPSLIEFIRQRSSRPAVPIIVVTTETDPAKLDAVQRLGATAIFDKGFTAEAVRKTVEGLGKRPGQ